MTEERTQSEINTQTAAQHAEIMEKVERLNEVIESNKVLTNEKERAEKTVKELAEKIKGLEGEMKPLKDGVQSLTSQKDALLAEKTALKNEIVRWTAKIKQLTEQYKDVDVDEYKRIKEEKKQFQQQISSLKADNQRIRTQTESLKSDLSKTQGELAGVRAMSQKSTDQLGSLKEEHQKELSKMQQEVESLKASVEAKTKEVNEKNATLLQVKRIARRYKTLVDEQTKEMEELKKKTNEAGQSTANGTAEAASSGLTAAENVDVAAQENKIKELTEQVKNFDEEVKKLKKIARHYKTLHEEQTKEMEELKKKFEDSGQATAEGVSPGDASSGAADLASEENKVKELTEQLKTAMEEVKKLKELDEQNKTSLKEKEDKNRKVLIQARERLKQLSATKDRLSAENEEFKKKHKSLSDEKEAVTQQLTESEMRMKVLNSQCEGKVTRLEKELQDYKTANDSKEKAVEEMMKQIEEYRQKEKVSPQINRSSFSFAAPGESSMSSEGVLELGMSEEVQAQVHSSLFKMADKVESLIVGRETRRNAGNLMSKLIADEQEVDDFYKTAFGGFEEESGDEKYSTEEEEADVVDSDFSVSETDEVIDDQGDDEPVKKRKKQFIKPYKAPKKDTAPSKATNKEPEVKKRKSFEDAPREGVRKSTRALTVERAEATKNRFKLEKEKKNLLKKKQPKKFLDMRRLTQEELLAEAKITEEENVASLQAYQQLEADKKKTKIQKVALKGPIIRFHSLSMPVVEVSEPLVKVDDNEDEEVNVDSTKRCCRNFLIFTDAKNFPSAYFPTKKLKVPHRTYCPVTGSPARYQDPVTGLPFANAQAFRCIRERYAMQAEEMKGKTSELEQRRARKL